ncbi:MAG: hypothetical protein V3W18_05600 [candidate division Zixibacteria bacterium]
MSKDNQINDTLRCYFFGVTTDDQNEESLRGLSGFAIPDLGIVYKNTFEGTLHQCQYNGLLTLLRFVNNNMKSFRGFEFEIFSDAAVVVYQLNHHKSLSRGLREPYNAVIGYKSKIPFKTSWIPRHENQAISGLLESPPFNPDIEIKFEDKRYSDIDRMGKGQIGQ